MRFRCIRADVFGLRGTKCAHANLRTTAPMQQTTAQCQLRFRRPVCCMPVDSSWLCPPASIEPGPMLCSKCTSYQPEVLTVLPHSYPPLRPVCFCHHCAPFLECVQDKPSFYVYYSDLNRLS